MAALAPLQAALARAGEKIQPTLARLSDRWAKLAPEQQAVLGAAGAFLAYVALRRRTQTLEERFAPKDGVSVYGNFASPCTRRVLLHLALGGVKYRFVEVNLLKGEQRHPSYRAINPLAKAPSGAELASALDR